MSLRPPSVREKIAAGKRDRILTIERFSLTRNENNEPIETWAELATVWAAKTDVSDSEKVRAAQVSSTISTRFQILWLDSLANLSGRDRLKLDGRTYDIVGTKELGTREGIEISAVASADA